MSNGSKAFKDNLKKRRTRPSSRRARSELAPQAGEHCEHDFSGEPTKQELEALERADKAKRRRNGHGMNEEELKAELKALRELEHQRHHKAARRKADAKSRLTAILMGEAKGKRKAPGKPLKEMSEEERKAARAARNKRRNAVRKADRTAEKVAKSLSSRKPQANNCRRARLKAKRKAKGTWRRKS